jgi:hypothetical protein
MEDIVQLSAATALGQSGLNIMMDVQRREFGYCISNV